MSEPTADNAAAVDFLEWWRPGGPWVLTAISPDRRTIQTETLTDATAALAWLEERNGRLNLYFHVNPCRRPLQKKAEREDIAELAWLHVDIDPRAAEERAGRLGEEQQRALDLLRTPPRGVPPPTCIIFSGGGYQGFWRLRDPMEIDGDAARYEQAACYNRQLELLFGADNCHNVDRIMRLPGTINLPDKKKLAKGRRPALATLVERSERDYSLSEFTPAAPTHVPGEQSFDTPTREVQVSGNVPRFSSDDLEGLGLSERTQLLVLQGSRARDVLGPKEGDDSRSAWLFDCVCQMVREGLPDEAIYSIITDPEFGISESVLDKGSLVERYARKQIAAAKDHCIDPKLSQMNARYAVIGNVGGKCRVAEEQEDPHLHRSRLTLMSFGDFRNFWCNERVQVGTDKNDKPVYMPLGKWWLEHPRRRQYDRIVFAPGEQEVGRSYNLWRGFRYEARPGDCSLYLEHLRQVVCGGEERLYQYLVGWMARVVQRPATPGHSAIVLRGKKGTGKGEFARHFGRLFGRHFLQVGHPSHLVGNFNAHLRDCLVLFGDEAFYAGDKKHESVLKTLITEEMLAIEAKGYDVEAAPNYVHLILASNEQWVVPAGEHERRFLVLDISDEHRQDNTYFRAMNQQMRAGGYEALLHHLMTLDLSEFEVRRVPETRALQDQTEMSLDPLESWWLHKLLEGQLLPDSPGEGWPRQVSAERLREDYYEQMRRANVSRRASPILFGKFLTRVCCSIRKFQVRQADMRPYMYELPPLEQARREWEAAQGPVDWPELAQSELPRDPDDEVPF